VYCFVHLGELGSLPRFFLVPSEVVSEQCSREHSEWVAAAPAEKKERRLDTSIRNFWFYDDQSSDYEARWDLLAQKLNPDSFVR
jgi:hypothetical protein